MEVFESEGQYVIEHGGRKWDVLCVRLPERMSRDAVGERYINSVVQIGGRRYRVKGVESWLILELPKGAPIAFMVEFAD